MFKKIWAIVLVAVAVVCLAGCKDKKEDPKEDPKRTYVVDGSYVAYQYGDNSGAPELTWVTVKIENDKIVDVDINTIQSDATTNDASEVTGHTWKAKNKKELGYEYGMFQYQAQLDPSTEEYKTWLKENNKLEWFEQVELIEKKIVADQNADGFTVAGGKVTNVTGVSVSSESYVTLAKAAIQNAKNGKVVAVRAAQYNNSAEYVVATADVNAQGKLSNIVIDERQNKVVEGKVAWNEKTKQELGYAYGMHQYTAQLDPTTEEYKTWLKDNNKLEWFEQVALIVNVWKTTTPTVNNGKFTNVTGCTIANTGYAEVLEQLTEYGFKK